LINLIITVGVSLLNHSFSLLLRKAPIAIRYHEIQQILTSEVASSARI